MNKNRQIDYLPLNSLKPDPRNPKDHDKHTIDASISRFGVLDPIVRDERTGYIISGHGRHKAFTAMRERGETPPEGVKINDEGEWLVPVMTGWSSRSDTESAAALIALNRTTELGGWVDESLLELLEDLEYTDDGLTGVGFSESEIDDLRAKLEEIEIEAREDTGWEDGSDGTARGLSIQEHTEIYESQSRRMLVLDYPVEEYREVVSRLRALRGERGHDNNSDVIAELLAEAHPEIAEYDSGEEEAGYETEDEYKDPAATLEKD